MNRSPSLHFAPVASTEIEGGHSRRSWLKRFGMASVLGSSGLVVSCNQDSAESVVVPPIRQTRVAVPNTWIQSLVQLVGGEYVVVTSLLKPVEGRQLLKRSARFEGPLLTSHLAIQLGLGWDDGLQASFKAVQEENRKTNEYLTQNGQPPKDEVKLLSLESVFPKDRLLRQADGAVDPHVWLDPTLWKQAIDPISYALQELHPEAHKATLEMKRHAAHYSLNQLIRILERWDEVLTTPQRRLACSQPSFSYLARLAKLTVEPGSKKVDPLHPVAMLNELVLDSLQPPDTRRVGRTETRDLGTYDGWILYAMDVMVECLKDQA